MKYLIHFAPNSWGCRLCSQPKPNTRTIGRAETAANAWDKKKYLLSNFAIRLEGRKEVKSFLCVSHVQQLPWEGKNMLILFCNRNAIVFTNTEVVET